MDILISKKNGILVIEFNRPEKKNSITAAMYQTIADALKDAQIDTAVRVMATSALVSNPTGTLQ